MTKEEFKSKKEIINSKMNELNNEMIKLKKEYIKSNVKYPIGSKVCITTPASVYTSLHDLTGVTVPETKQYAYIVGYDVSYLCDIKPLFKKINKDGSVSKVNLYVNLENVVIELVQGHEEGRSRNS